MENNKSTSENLSLLQVFAVKKSDKSIIIGDRAITYNRCSTEKQDSVEWQTRITAGFVKQNNWQLVKAFGAKESAKTDDRKEFQAMLEFSRKENITHIVFYSYDRFSRAGNVDLIDKLRNEDGIKIHSATQHVDDTTPSGRMMQKLYLVIAKMDNDQRSCKVIEGQRNKVLKGEFVSRPPMGYDKRYPVINGVVCEQEKKQCYINAIGVTIRQVFIWKDTENLSNVEILRRLETMGLKLKHCHLTAIFRNPFYCGYIRHSFLDGQLIKGKHEPLIDEETFLRVNGIQNSKNGIGRKNLNRLEEMPLKGTIKCGKCGRPLTGYFQKKIYLYYKCPNQGCCVNVRSQILTQLFTEKFSLIKVDQELVPAIKQQLALIHATLHQNESVRVKPMKDELARLKTELEAMELNFATGKLSTNLYHKHSSTHTDKINEIEDQLVILSKDTSNLLNYIDKSIEIAQNLTKMWENLDYTDKVRLQKLVYPEGIAYEPENRSVRTLTMNPIFLAIGSISTFLSCRISSEMIPESPNFSQLYLSFGSSNFFWENLEETAILFDDMKNQGNRIQFEYVSKTYPLPMFDTTSSTLCKTHRENGKVCNITQSFSGVTSSL